MQFEMTPEVHARMHEFFALRIGKHLRRSEQRALFATYALGVVSDGERKSVEPIAARITGDERMCKRMHDKLLHFVGRSPWDDRSVRREAANYAIEALQKDEPVTTWIIDDTGFEKQGKHSVGVQRQYTGTAGKITNCQVGVSLSVATRSEHLPIDFALYLPKSWAEDNGRRRIARIPDDVIFETKIELALGLIERAAHDKIPGDIVLADAGYGNSNDFRDGVRMYGFDYAVAVNSNTLVWPLDTVGRRNAPSIEVKELGLDLGRKAFRRITWREGTRHKMHSRFCFRRVKIAHEHGADPSERESLWLMIEWPDGESKPTKFFLTSLPRRMSKKQIVRIVKERWRTERAYEDLKGELGLDHFEGRSFPGWHHHVSVVLCCYAFIVAERTRHFPPSAGREDRDSPLEVAA